MSSYYSLAYRPAPRRRPHGAPHRRRRPGQKDCESAIAAANRGQEPGRADGPIAWRAPLYLGLMSNPLAARLGAGTVREADGGGFTLPPLTSWSRPSGWAFLPVSESFAARLTLQVAASDEHHRNVVFEQKSFRFDQASGEPPEGSMLDLAIDLELGGGAYVVAVALRDEASRETSLPVDDAASRRRRAGEEVKTEKEREVSPMNALARFSAMILAALWAASPATAQTAPADSPAFGETVDVQWVNVEVWVTDGQGNPVTGLSRGDFEVREDGRVVQVTGFAEIRESLPGDPFAPTDPIEAPVEADQRPLELEDLLRKDPRDEEQAGFLTLYFDELFSGITGREQLIEDLRTFVELRRVPASKVLIPASGRAAPRRSQSRLQPRRARGRPRSAEERQPRGRTDLGSGEKRPAPHPGHVGAGGGARQHRSWPGPVRFFLRRGFP